MKIILSRKGFDRSNGGFASPIMPCGKPLSLPIPVTANQKKEGEKGICYDKLKFDGQYLSETISQLSNRPFPHKEAHLDPDLDRDRLESREEGWKQAFGQTGSAQSHLKNQGVVKEKISEGCLFLFYGWFKEGGQDRHVIFGWLKVGEILEVHNDQALREFPDWLHYHPHIVNRDRVGYTNNRIYIAADHLTLDGLSLPGAGTFSCLTDARRLTAPHETRRSYWRLPKWFHPFYPVARPERERLSYHGSCKRWELHNNHVILKTTSPGQEFVFDTKDYSEAMQWLKDVFED